MAQIIRDQAAYLRKVFVSVWDLNMKLDAHMPRLIQTIYILFLLPLGLLFQQYDISKEALLNDPKTRLLTILIGSYILFMLAAMIAVTLIARDLFHTTQLEYPSRNTSLWKLRLGMVGISILAIVEYAHVHSFLTAFPSDTLVFVYAHILAVTIYEFLLIDTSFACVSSIDDYFPVTTVWTGVSALGAACAFAVGNMIPVLHFTYILTICLLLWDTYTLWFQSDKFHFLKDCIGKRVEYKLKDRRRVEQATFHSIDDGFLCMTAYFSNEELRIPAKTLESMEVDPSAARRQN